MKLKNLTSRIKSSITRMANSGLSAGSIAKRLGLSVQLVSSYIKQRKPEKYINRKEREKQEEIRRREERKVKMTQEQRRDETERREFNTQSGRKSKLVRDLVRRFTPEKLREMTTEELNRLNKKMQNEVWKSLKGLYDADIENAATSAVEKNRLKYQDSYGMEFGDIYFTEQTNYYGALKQAQLLRKYLVEYKTGSIAGHRKVEKAEKERFLQNLPGNYKEIIKNMNEEQSKKFWGAYRELVNSKNGFLVSQRTEFNEFFYGSDVMQAVLLQTMHDPGIHTFDDLMDYLLSINRDIYEYEKALEAEDVKRRKGYIVLKTEEKLKGDKLSKKAREEIRRYEESEELPFL